MSIIPTIRVHKSCFLLDNPPPQLSSRADGSCECVTCALSLVIRDCTPSSDGMWMIELRGRVITASSEMGDLELDCRESDDTAVSFLVTELSKLLSQKWSPKTSPDRHKDLSQSNKSNQTHRTAQGQPASALHQETKAQEAPVQGQ